MLVKSIYIAIMIALFAYHYYLLYFIAYLILLKLATINPTDSMHLGVSLTTAVLVF